jgi:hypothetical protein
MKKSFYFLEKQKKKIILPKFMNNFKYNVKISYDHEFIETGINVYKGILSSISSIN